MGDHSLYDEDILIWSEQQAAALRRLASRRDLPNDLDLPNVIEEIEDVGKSEFHSVESLIGNILTLILFDRGAPAAHGWGGGIATWRAAIGRRITPSMRRKLDLDSLWRESVGVAHRKSQPWGKQPMPPEQARLVTMPCPIGLDELLDPDADILEVVARIAAAASQASNGATG